MLTKGRPSYLEETQVRYVALQFYHKLRYNDSRYQNGRRHTCMQISDKFIYSVSNVCLPSDYRGLKKHITDIKEQQQTLQPENAQVDLELPVLMFQPDICMKTFY
jgi:hypothetical protein